MASPTKPRRRKPIKTAMAVAGLCGLAWVATPFAVLLTHQIKANEAFRACLQQAQPLPAPERAAASTLCEAQRAESYHEGRLAFHRTLKLIIFDAI